MINFKKIFKFGFTFNKNVTVNMINNEKVENIYDANIVDSYSDKIVDYLNIDLNSYIKNIKITNTSFLKTERNIEYERNLFLYKVGFKSIKRVKEFINTMNKINDIEEFSLVEKKYSKYGLELLNTEIIKNIKSKYKFETYKNNDFVGDISNSDIDILKNNYEKIEDVGLTFLFYHKYYKSDGWKKIEDFNIINYFYNKNKYLDGLDNDNEISINSYYWKIRTKPLEVLYNFNTNKGMVIINVQPDYYLVLCELNENDDKKLNFKDFIKELKNN